MLVDGIAGQKTKACTHNSVCDNNVVLTITIDHLSPILDQYLPASSTFSPVPSTSNGIPSFMDCLAQRCLEVCRQSGDVMVSAFCNP